jgi:hypothetical protein
MAHTNNRLFAVTLTMLFVALFLSTAQAQDICRQKGGTPCYFIASNLVETGFGMSSRNMDVLLDRMFFNEADLKKLSKHFLSTYREPDEIHISLNSTIFHLKDLVLNSLVSGEPHETYWTHPVGVIFRVNGNEVIRYSDPSKQKPGTIVWRTIVLKGVDPAGR